MSSILICFILIVVLLLQINLLYRKVDKLEYIQEILDKQQSNHNLRINQHNNHIDTQYDELIKLHMTINGLEAEIRGLREVHNRNVETVTQILKSQGKSLENLRRRCFGLIRREELERKIELKKRRKLKKGR